MQPFCTSITETHFLLFQAKNFRSSLLPWLKTKLILSPLLQFVLFWLGSNAFSGSFRRNSRRAFTLPCWMRFFSKLDNMFGEFYNWLCFFRDTLQLRFDASASWNSVSKRKCSYRWMDPISLHIRLIPLFYISISIYL